MAALSANAQNAVAQVQALPPEEQKAVVQQVTANPDLFPRSDASRTKLWMTLLYGLFAVALGAIIATVVLQVMDEDGTAVVALATAAVAGDIGLFANPPTS